MNADLRGVAVEDFGLSELSAFFCVYPRLNVFRLPTDMLRPSLALLWLSIVGPGEPRDPAPTSRILATSRTGTGIAYQSLRRSPTLFHTSKTIGVSPCVTSSWRSALVSSRSARFRPKRANRLVAADRWFTPGGPRSSCTGRFRRFGESTSIRGNFSGATPSVPLLCGLDRTSQSASSLPNQRRVLCPTSRQLRLGST
jgi:hypothetical protein